MPIKSVRLLDGILKIYTAYKRHFKYNDTETLNTKGLKNILCILSQKKADVTILIYQWL